MTIAVDWYVKQQINQTNKHSDVRLYDGPDIKLFILVGWDQSFLSVAWPTGVQLVFFFCSGVSKLFSIVGQLTESASSFLIHQDVYHDLSVCY